MRRLPLMTAISLAAILNSTGAQAADLSYTWIEGGLMRITPATTGFTTPYTSPGISGKYIGGSWGLSEHVALSADYDYATQGGVASCDPSTCVSPAPVVVTTVGSHDMHEVSAGVTYHADVTEGLQWLAALEYLHAAYDAFGGVSLLCGPDVGCPQFAIAPGPSDATAVGHDLSAGLRWLPFDSWEFDARLGHRSMNAGARTPLDQGTDYSIIGDGSANFVEAAALFDISSHWALRLDALHLSTPHNRYLLGIRYSF